MAWFTTDDGRHVNTEWFDEDTRRKYAQIEANKKEADWMNAQEELASMGKKPSKLTGGQYTELAKTLTPEELRARFQRETNIRVNSKVLTVVPHEKLAEIYDVIADIQSTYEPNISQITLVPEDSPDALDRMADMSSDGTLRLVSQCFSNPEFMQKNNNANKDKYCPHTVYSENDGYKSTIAHEMGHAILFSRMNYWYDVQSDPNAYTYYHEAIAFLDLEWPRTTPGNKLYNNLYGAFDGITERLNNDPEIMKMWGGANSPRRPNLSLVGFANPMFSIKGIAISEYAGSNYHELVAESFCDVYCNGYKNASRLSQEVYNTIIKGEWWK